MGKNNSKYEYSLGKLFFLQVTKNLKMLYFTHPLGKCSESKVISL